MNDNEEHDCTCPGCRLGGKPVKVKYPKTTEEIRKDETPEESNNSR